MNRLDLAVDHFARGLAENHRLGNRVDGCDHAGRAGATLLHRGQVGDEARGRELVEAAIVDLRSWDWSSAAACSSSG